MQLLIRIIDAKLLQANGKHKSSQKFEKKLAITSLRCKFAISDLHLRNKQSTPSASTSVLPIRFEVFESVNIEDGDEQILGSHVPSQALVDLVEQLRKH